MNADLEQSAQKTNAEMGQGCCDVLYPEDGRVTYGDKNQHKGDWGRHRKKEDGKDWLQKTIC